MRKSLFIRILRIRINLKRIKNHSEWKISPYVGMKFDISDNQRIEAGFVANYATSPVIPWVRYVNRIFFIAPGIVSKTTDYVFNGELFESTTSYYASTVIGIELRKNILIVILAYIR